MPRYHRKDPPPGYVIREFPDPVYPGHAQYDAYLEANPALTSPRFTRRLTAVNWCWMRHGHAPVVASPSVPRRKGPAAPDVQPARYTHAPIVTDIPPFISPTRAYVRYQEVGSHPGRPGKSFDELWQAFASSTGAGPHLEFIDVTPAPEPAQLPAPATPVEERPRARSRRTRTSRQNDPS